MSVIIDVVIIEAINKKRTFQRKKIEKNVYSNEVHLLLFIVYILI